MRKFFQAILFCVFTCSPLCAAQAPPPAVTNSSNTSGFISLNGRFKISLPQTVNSFEAISLQTPKGMATGDDFKWQVPEGFFGIAYIDGPDSYLDPETAKQALNRIHEQIVLKVHTVNGKLSETDISLSGNPGREYKMELPDNLLLVKVYLSGNRMYQLTLLLTKELQSQAAAAMKILNSFTILTAAEVEVAMKKKIADATPALLPQEPVAKGFKQDSLHEGLKGKVKTVAAENEDISTPGKRKPSSTERFNEKGNLTHRESYDYKGNLSDVTVYGFIDGDRVLNIKSIEYEYNPPPGMAPPPPPEQTLAKPDARYMVKYKYKYDNKGNRLEEEVYGNNGALRVRYVYNRKEKQREELTYSAEGVLATKYLFTLDDKENITEKTEITVKDGSVREKYTYKYEFDGQGNWIKRTTEKWVVKDGNSIPEPGWITYRTITYY
jgi:hypothetical protein